MLRKLQLTRSGTTAMSIESHQQIIKHHGHAMPMVVMMSSWNYIEMPI